MDAREVIEQLRESGRLHVPRAYPDDPAREDLLQRFFAATADIYDAEDVERLRSERGAFFDGSRDAYAEIVAALTQELLDALEPSPLRQRLADPARFAVAVEDIYEPNARSFRRGGSWLALIDRSMVGALYVCARAIAGRVNRAPGTAACEACEHPSCSTPSAAKTARRWLESGWRATRPARQPAELWMPDGAGLAYANALATAAESFLLAHEIAHHVAGHTEAAVLGAHSQALPTAGGTREFLPSWSMEFEADVLAAQLTANAALQRAKAGENAGEVDGSGVVRAALGAEHFLTCAELWQRTGGLPSHSASHPPIAQRRLALRSFWLNSPQLEPLEGFIEDLRAFLRGLWRVLQEPGDHDLAVWQRERDEVMPPIERAFEQVAGREPDHLAEVAPALNRLRAASSQLLFDAALWRYASSGSPGRAAAAVFFHLFCDTPPEVAAAVDASAPFLGLETFLVTDGEFAAVDV